VFNKLKRKFVMINMSLLTIVFIAIFSVIYMLTAISGERQIASSMHNIMFSPPRPFPDNPVVATSIVVDLDKQDNILNSFSYMNINKETIEQAVLLASESESLTANIKLGDTYYAFLKRSTPQGTKLVFVDRTLHQKNLNNLLVIFILVGSISLVLLLSISIYFANRAIRPIKEMFEKQKQFIADASHELKTPLTVIKTNTSLISTNSEKSVKSQAKWLEYICLQVDKMSSLVDDMLSLAKYDYAEQSSFFIDFDLSKTLNSSVLSFEAILFEKNIELNAQIQPDIFLNGEKESIKRLINILMDNAVKNTPENGSISVKLGCDKNKVEIAVKNTGTGIPSEHIEKIFERFYRVDTSRSKESGGYGIGLSIAKSIVEQHKGKIYAQSNVGTDTTFIVILPYR